jgi:hypothetical protein
LLLARAIGDSDREAATGEAKAALTTFETLGAARDADAAAACLRSLGLTAAHRRFDSGFANVALARVALAGDRVLRARQVAHPMPLGGQKRGQFT